MSLFDHKSHNFMYQDNLFDIITLQYSVMFINIRKRKENNFFNLFIDKKKMTQLVVISLIALVHGKEMIKCRFKLLMLQCFHNSIFMYTIYTEILKYNMLYI